MDNISMSNKQKLELTWIGKDERPKLEPRILIEDPELSYHADKRYGENDQFDNILIQGDNLLALKALEQDYAGKVKCIYIDPPYNSRQYSRFYHIYENLVQWKKPELFGIALKPKPENLSKYCTVKAKESFRDLVEKLDVKYLVVSYNNTYKSKSKSSANKIKFEEIVEILEEIGETKIFEQSYTFFNAGKTEFNDHKEYLFLTKKYE